MMMNRLLFLISISLSLIGLGMKADAKPRLDPAIKPVGSTDPVFLFIPPPSVTQGRRLRDESLPPAPFWPSQRVIEHFASPANVYPGYVDEGQEARAAAYASCRASDLHGLALPAYMRRADHRYLLVEDGVFVTDAETYSSAGFIYSQCIQRRSRQNIYLAKCGNNPRDCGI
jgi:hypothetical protein